MQFSGLGWNPNPQRGGERASRARINTETPEKVEKKGNHSRPGFPIQLASLSSDAETRSSSAPPSCLAITPIWQKFPLHRARRLLFFHHHGGQGTQLQARKPDQCGTHQLSRPPDAQREGIGSAAPAGQPDETLLDPPAEIGGQRLTSRRLRRRQRRDMEAAMARNGQGTKKDWKQATRTKRRSAEHRPPVVS